VSLLDAAQTWRQLVLSYGEDKARALFGLTNVIGALGGGKDGAFYRELSGLLGVTRVRRPTYQLPTGRMVAVDPRRGRSGTAPGGDPPRRPLATASAARGGTRSVGTSACRRPLRTPGRRPLG